MCSVDVVCTVAGKWNDLPYSQGTGRVGLDWVLEDQKDFKLWCASKVLYVCMFGGGILNSVRWKYLGRWKYFGSREQVQ